MSDDLLFSPNEAERSIARLLFERVENLPIVSPHGHTDPAWFAENASFKNPTDLLISFDHYLLRMLYSAGVSMEELGKGENGEKDPRKIWTTFAKNQKIFWGTPSYTWFNISFRKVFGLEERLSEKNANEFYDRIDELLKTEEFKPRSLFERFNIEVLCTTDSPVDSLEHHQKIRESGWKGRVIPCFRPDGVVDLEDPDFKNNIQKLSEVADIDCFSYKNYIQALRKRREFFISMGATSSDHGHPSAKTLELSETKARELFEKALQGQGSPEQAEDFRAHMLMEFAEMSLDDGLVMQLHAGPCRNHNRDLYQRLGRDIGADFPQATEYVNALKPMLNKFGNHKNFTLIAFTLDESTYARELAPMAGHYPALKLGPPWWFHDSPEGMLRYRRAMTESAGFYNTVGFNDDTRAFLSIPARHEVARRMDARHLAELVGDDRLKLEEAQELIEDLAYGLAKRNYKL